MSLEALWPFFLLLITHSLLSKPSKKYRIRMTWYMKVGVPAIGLPAIKREGFLWYYSILFQFYFSKTVLFVHIFKYIYCKYIFMYMNIYICKRIKNNDYDYIAIIIYVFFFNWLIIIFIYSRQFVIQIKMSQQQYYPFKVSTFI